jgi:hypothetical protein
MVDNRHMHNYIANLHGNDRKGIKYGAYLREKRRWCYKNRRKQCTWRKKNDESRFLRLFQSLFEVGGGVEQNLEKYELAS